MNVVVSPGTKAQVVVTDKCNQTILDVAAQPIINISARGPQGPGGGSGPILEASFLIEEDVTLREHFNGLSLGPVTIASGYSVTVPSGSYWMVI